MEEKNVYNVMKMTRDSQQSGLLFFWSWSFNLNSRLLKSLRHKRT